MKRRTTKLALAVATALGTAFTGAQAVELAQDGLGEVLIFPYYTVRNGYDTYLNVTNTSGYTVAFKVRFREAHNSRDARDFNVVLSPYDVWTAAVTLNPDGSAARVQTTDKTCTAPALPTISGDLKGIDFTNLDYIDTSNFVDGADREDWPTDEGRSLDRTKEGYITVIQMGHSRASTSIDADTVAYNAKHVNGVPRDCSFVVDSFENGIAEAEFYEPINVLKGTASLINVENGKAGGYDPTTLANFYNPLIDDGLGVQGDNIVFAPRDAKPNFTDASPALSVINDVDVAGGTITTSWDNPEDAVSAVLMRTAVINQFSVDKVANGAETDWVVTFPTKYFYVDEDEDRPAPGAPLAPFSQVFQDGDNGRSCDAVSFNFYDREEKPASAQSTSGFSPPQPGSARTEICKEVNVVTFDSLNVFGSSVSASVPVSNDDIVSGWMKLTFGDAGPLGDADSPNTEGHEYDGRPVVGFAYTTLENGVAGANLLNYGSIWNHSYTRNVSSSDL